MKGGLSRVFAGGRPKKAEKKGDAAWNIKI